MANSYTHTVACKFIKTTKDKFDELDQILKDAEQDEYHGMVVEFMEASNEMHLHSNESGSLVDLPQKALDLIGVIISDAGEPFWEFGEAWTCSKPRPGEFGGLHIRIYPDGALIGPTITWPEWPPEDEDGPAKERRSPPSSYPTFDNLFIPPKFEDNLPEGQAKERRPPESPDPTFNKSFLPPEGCDPTPPTQ